MAHRKPKYSNYLINSLTRRNIVRTLATHSFHHPPPSDKHPHWRLYWELGIHHEAWRIFSVIVLKRIHTLHFENWPKKKTHSNYEFRLPNYLLWPTHFYRVVWTVFVWTVCVSIYCLLITLATIGEIFISIANSREMFLFVTLNLHLNKFNFYLFLIRFTFFSCSCACHFRTDSGFRISNNIATWTVTTWNQRAAQCLV